MILAPILFHSVTRIFILFLYAVLIAGASYWVLELKVHFSQMYFVSEESLVKAWFDANQKYFQEGGQETIIYVQNEAEIDFSAIDQ